MTFFARSDRLAYGSPSSLCDRLPSRPLSLFAPISGGLRDPGAVAPQTTSFSFARVALSFPALPHVSPACY